MVIQPEIRLAHVAVRVGSARAERAVRQPEAQHGDGNRRRGRSGQPRRPLRQPVGLGVESAPAIDEDPGAEQDRRKRERANAAAQRYLDPEHCAGDAAGDECDGRPEDEDQPGHEDRAALHCRKSISDGRGRFGGIDEGAGFCRPHDHCCQLDTRIRSALCR